MFYHILMATHNAVLGWPDIPVFLGHSKFFAEKTGTSGHLIIIIIIMAFETKNYALWKAGSADGLFSCKTDWTL